MKRLKTLLLILVLLVIPSSVGAVYESQICVTKGATTCQPSEVGQFMQGISKTCGNAGDCGLDDILMVFVNVGNFVTGIIGAVVLLMYVLGGFFWVASAGNKEWVDRGKNYIKISTTGLIIVMFAYLGIFALQSAITSGDFNASDGREVACTGPETLGEVCGLNKTCTEGGYLCKSLCEQRNETEFEDASPGAPTQQNIGYHCVDINDPEYTGAPSIDNLYGSRSYNGCTQNLCPGPANMQCCQVTDWR